MEPKKKIKNQTNDKKTTGTKKIQVKIRLNLWKIIVGTIIVLFFLPALLSLFEVGSSSQKLNIGQAMADIKEGKVKEVNVTDNKLILTYKDDSIKTTTKESQDSLFSMMEKADVDPSIVKYTVTDQSLSKAITDILGILLPILLMAGLFLFIMKSQSKGAQDIFSFGRSKAKLFAKGKQDITFADVAGVDDAKKELEEIVDFLKNPAKYRKIGARTPKGVILFGPSGVGKTLLARAVAGQAGVPFFSMAGSEFMEMLVGVGPSRVRDLFAQAKASAPSIIFIDEIDAIGRQRGGRGFVGGHDEREQTLNQILVEMDGFSPNDSTLVIAASVTGDTPVVIKEKEKVQLVPIGDFVDRYYENPKQEGEIDLKGVECLGFESNISDENSQKNLDFGNSVFKKVRSVFRHKVNEIYEIEYLGGTIRATGNHSVFVRNVCGIKTKAVSELKEKDVLVDLPFKVSQSNKNAGEARAHRFNPEWSLTLPLFDTEIEAFWQDKYQYAISASVQGYSQLSVAQTLGVSQCTIGNWISGVYEPQAITRKIYKNNPEKLPETLEITPDLCRLLGYYVAEGYSRWELDFCFGLKEKELITDVISLMQEIFGLIPKMRTQTHNAVNLVYNSAPVSKFFARLCGKGAHNKHVPAFLFEAPYDYFREFLRGVWLGDGYEDKWGRGEITTVSKNLALELNWIARMHGIKTYVGGFIAKKGRQINGGKPLQAVRAWRVGWGKAANPFTTHQLKKRNPAKRAIVKRVAKLPFNGYVYDLCGVENEAFFGGESPVLLHNTNRGDLLDPALLRPGRFDRRVMLDMPDKDGRSAILKIHARGKLFVKGINWEKVSDRTVGFSGADLENMLNEAAIHAARAGKEKIETSDIEEAATKVKLGPAKRRLQSKEDKKITAYHEAGHGVVTHFLPKMDPVERISIVARGMSLGHTLIPPAADRSHETKSRMLNQITAMLGGRAAEEVVFNEMTSGASNDIEKATSLARAMVTEFGMSVLGPINLGPQYDMDELGKANWYEPAQVSPAMQENIDLEIRNIIEASYKEAIKIVKSKRKILDNIVDELMEEETLGREEFEKIVGKKS